ncbi:TIGD4 [Cordylochernes scorpioides]|uniref:TIGD4 n=1 Tax=Cordylochernes scorpioides TaxID=51811 RepID=A0ABY6KFG6_9ARAC|nr:TIGD4 [Cordylochernes scorpioides]
MSRDERILQRKLSYQKRRIDGFIESVDSIIEAGETIRLEIMGEELKEIKEKIEKLYDELFSLDEVDIDKESEAYDGSMNKIGSLRANCNDSHVLLATARIKIKNGLGKLCTCRALLDSGSQVTMITKGCCERLGLVQRKSDRMIIGVGNTPVQHSSSTVSVTFCPLNNSEEFSVEAVVTGVLTSEIPNFRFRTYPVAITADIEKMYRQIRIHPEDADYQRILWRPSPEEPVVDYRLLTVTYGTTSAPFLAMRTLQQLAEDEGQNYPEASRVTLNDFYVDDLLTGAQTIAETKELIDQLKDLMKRGGFHLRKWNSNCHEIVSHVEEMNEEKKINLEKGAISKILGIVWDHVQDTFRVNITLPEEVVTKRELLSNIARIFDPLGFLSPTTVALKIIMQELWRSGTGWDEHIPNDIKEKWNNFRAELLKLGECSLFGCVLLKNSLSGWTSPYINACSKNQSCPIWKTFIHNRVVKIQQLSDRNSWRHVSGKDNPADCASRGIMPAALSGHTLWWQGPTWLKDNNFVQNQDNCYGRECHEEEKVALACQSRVSAPNSTVASGQDPQVKLQILREIEVEKKKKTDVAQKHNIPQSSLSTIIKNSEKIHQQALHAGESSRKRARGSTYADVDEALLQWFKQARSAALPVNGPLLSEKAKTLALEFGLKDFTGSGGWIERWEARHGIKLRNICGESADVNRETMTNWLTDVMPNIISNYACKDIFNADETGLFWRLLPDKTLHFKGETCTGGKASKERITILLCCNMDGSEKMQPLVIGKAKQPRCFRGIKHLPVQYEANQKAWMTGLLFESWVRHIDKKMAGQHRQIILLLDNCGAHPPDMQGLTNTRIAFLPPNTTSMLQPCDQGIIRNFKMIYRTRLMRKYLTAYDAGTALTINLKQAVDIISVAWNDVLPATISNCWHHSGIIKSDVSSPLDTPQPATQILEQQSLFDRMKEVLKIPLEMDFDSYADADNDVVTNAMLSDVEIVESILQAKEEEETDQVDEEVDPIVHIPHPKEVLESIQTLRLFLQCQDESKSLHRHLSDLDNIEKSVQHLLLTSKRQKKITNYFSKNT